MSGIRERRLWPRGTRPSEQSIESGRKAIEAAGIDPREIGCLIHGSVCRDQLEPATACRVHDALGLPRECLVYDVSNACLGLLNGMVQVANLIELGQIRAGLVVGTEDSRALLGKHDRRAESRPVADAREREAGVCLADDRLGQRRGAARASRTSAAPAIASSAAAARAHTAHHELCAGRARSGGQRAIADPDADRLRAAAGRRTGRRRRRRSASFWPPAAGRAMRFTRSICHQVGGTHRRLMLESLGLPAERDYATFPWLGNTGSVALPITLALADRKRLHRAATSTSPCSASAAASTA